MVDMGVIRGVKEEESDDMTMLIALLDLSSENFICEIEEEEVEKMATEFLKVIEVANESEAVFQTINDDERKRLSIDVEPSNLPFKSPWSASLEWWI
ncbi:hypothetical protein NL676_036428 [Syzygium grande]|nr:hypothetical protein NL676_036428 [Syzygium grande]